jgi:hypothetical protein
VVVVELVVGAEDAGVDGLLVVAPHATDAIRPMTDAARIIPLMSFSFVPAEIAGQFASEK